MIEPFSHISCLDCQQVTHPFLKFWDLSFIKDTIVHYKIICLSKPRAINIVFLFPQASSLITAIAVSLDITRPNQKYGVIGNMIVFLSSLSLFLSLQPQLLHLMSLVLTKIWSHHYRDLNAHILSTSNYHKLDIVTTTATSLTEAIFQNEDQWILPNPNHHSM